MPKCRPLATNGVVGVVALGAPASPVRLAQGIKEIEHRGFQVRMPLDASAYYGKYDHGFANGSVSARLDALQTLLADPDVQVVMAARGQYGANSLLPELNFTQWSDHQKVLIGYSDVSLMLVALYGRTGLPMIHGPMVSTELAEYESDTCIQPCVDALFSMLTDPEYRQTLDGVELVPGSAEGLLIAGNLTVLASLLGTPWDISYDGHILVVEDLGESPFRIDRKLRQLEAAGKFTKLQGLVFGRFAKCDAQHGPQIEDILHESATRLRKKYGFPILSGLALGHKGPNYPLPIGCRARIVERELQLLESPITLR